MQVCEQLRDMQAGASSQHAQRGGNSYGNAIDAPVAFGCLVRVESGSSIAGRDSSDSLSLFDDLPMAGTNRASREASHSLPGYPGYPLAVSGDVAGDVTNSGRAPSVSVPQLGSAWAEFL